MTDPTRRRGADRRSSVATLLTRLAAVDTGVDGRLVMLGTVAIYGIGVALADLVLDVDLWRVLGVPSGPIIFVDTHNLTAAGECVHRGIDPFVENPCDIDARPWNYSRLWLLLSALGMDLGWTAPLALVTIVAFLVAVYVLMGRLTTGEGIILTALACSPSVMFAIEHAQADLLMFVLVAVSAVSWRAGGRWRTLSPIWVLLAGLLKLFPILGLGAYLLSRHLRAIGVAIGCGVIFATYWLVRIDELSAIAERAPQGEYHSFGARILLSHVARRAGVDSGIGGATGQLIATAVLGAGVLALVWWAWHRVPLTFVEHADWRLFAFHLGAVIHLASFAVFNSWDYRLIFLLLLLPQLFAWLRSDHDSAAIWSSVTLVMIVGQVYLGAVLAYWTLDETTVDYSRLPPWSLADEIVSWLLAAILTVLLTPSLRTTVIWKARTGSSRRRYPKTNTRRAWR